MKKSIPFSSLSILIIGGNGAIGSTFVKVFQKLKLKVYVLEKKNSKELQHYLNLVNVIILSVPIDKTHSLIKKVGPLLNKNQLLMDLTSIKKDFIKLMKESTKAEIISLHPLFGPLKNISGQNIIILKVRGQTFYSTIKKLLEKLKLKTLEIPASKHDPAMAVIQSLVHLMAFTLIKTTKDLGFSFKELEKIATPLYRLHFDLANRLLYQSSELYADISFLNPYVEKTGRTFQENFDNYLKMINRQERDEFIQSFKKNASLLKDKKAAFLRSEKIMEYLASIE